MCSHQNFLLGKEIKLIYKEKCVRKCTPNIFPMNGHNLRSTIWDFDTSNVKTITHIHAYVVLMYINNLSFVELKCRCKPWKS